MSNDPQGSDTPRGDHPESNDFGAAEDFLGLHADSNGTDPGTPAPSNDAGLPTEPVSDDGIYDPMAAAGPPGGIYDPEKAAAPQNAELDPSVETQVSEDLADATGDAASDGEAGGGDGFEMDFDEEGASWLMEFDGAESDEEQEEAFAQAFEEDPDGLDDDFVPSLAEPDLASESNPWLGRSILAVVSVALGVVGSKFIAEETGGVVEPAGIEIAKADPPTSSKQAGPDAKGDAKASPDGGQANEGPKGAKPANAEGANKPTITTNPDKIAKQTKPQTKPNGNAGPKPGQGNPNAGGKGQALAGAGAGKSGGADGPLAPGQLPSGDTKPGPQDTEPSGLVIQVGDTGLTGEVFPDEIESTQGNPAMEEEHGSLRQASAHELASVWSGDSIPREAVHGEKRLLTPGVGDVRVLLYAGEVFEGKLYAVGNRRIWLETKIGKMALLEWQIDSYEKIADSTTLGLGNAKTVAGLQSVRVRTAGGVFYGKLVSHKGSTVTIITASGARLTLEDAELATAGRSTSHVIDASKMEVAKAETE